MDFSVVIMAGGKGTRMKSELPKPLHELAGRPMLHWIIEAAKTAGAKQIITIVRKDNQVAEHALDTEVVYQMDQQGTGAAVLSAKGTLRNPVTVVLSGDNPLVSPDLIRGLAEALNGGAVAAVLTTKSLPPAGYGRIVREKGKVKAIIETKEPEKVSPEILDLNEVNIGVYAFKSAELFEELDRAPVEANGEVYLTSVIPQLLKAGQEVASLEAADPMVGAGVNTPEELKTLEHALRERQVTNRK